MTPKEIDIAARIQIGTPAALLGTHVGGRAHPLDQAAWRRAFIVTLGQPGNRDTKVDDLGLFATLLADHHDVVWLEIAMQDAVGVGVMCPARHFGHQRQTLTTIGAAPGNPLAHGQAFNPLHGQIGLPFQATSVINLRDERVTQSRQRLAFHLEQRFGQRAPQALLQQFQGNDPVDRRLLAGAIDLPHSPAADRLLDRVRTERLARRERVQIVRTAG